MATLKSFEDLEIWKKSRLLCYNLKQLIDNTESLRRNYSLCDQMLRASGSIMDNIAEGFGRKGNREFIHFLSIAQGSCNETKSQLYRAFDFGYITAHQREQLFDELNQISIGTKSLINYLYQSEYKGNKFRTKG